MSEWRREVVVVVVVGSSDGVCALRYASSGGEVRRCSRGREEVWVLFLPQSPVVSSFRDAVQRRGAPSTELLSDGSRTAAPRSARLLGSGAGATRPALLFRVARDASVFATGSLCVSVGAATYRGSGSGSTIRCAICHYAHLGQWRQRCEVSDSGICFRRWPSSLSEPEPPMRGAAPASAAGAQPRARGTAADRA